MPNQNTLTLATYVERARKVLQYEQHTNHQDQAIRPGGLDAFTARWYNETQLLCQDNGLDFGPIQRIVEHLQGYRQQDPMQRASSLRAALAILNELDGAQGLTTIPLQPSTEKSTKASSHARQAAATSASRQNQAAKLADETDPSRKVPSTSASRQNQAAKLADETDPSRKVPSAKPEIEVGRPLQSPPPAATNTVRLEAGMSAGHTALTLLSADITAIPGVGTSAATRLHNLSIHNVRDLLFYFPREHRDYSQLTRIDQIPFGELTTTMGLIWEVKTQRTGGGRTRTIAKISDETSSLYVFWFNQGYLQKQLDAAKGSYLVVTGVKQRFGNKVEFSVRSHELPEQGDLLSTGRLVPIYALTDGLHAKTLRRYTKWVVDHYAQVVPEHLPTSVRLPAQLLPLPEAVAQMHYPDNAEMREAAYQRLAFDELLLIQLGMQERRSRWQHDEKRGNAFSIDQSKIFTDPPAAIAGSTVPATPALSGIVSAGSTLWSVVATDEPFETTLPFAFTDAQRRVICEIFTDLAQSKPMCRLLQGDVGAGKTAVAAAALLMTALNGYQGAIMAPTELLAEQHARSIGKMLEPFGIQTVLLTGSQRQRERTQARMVLENGQAAVAIGTHALIQEDVHFHKLGLVIVDEQHRFGVEQRDALLQKGQYPHMLVMTATPIPRTLALTLYGDLDVSVIDQLPPGRQKIITRWRTGTRRSESYATVVHQVAEGRQAFIICPLIEESETLAVKAVTSEYERLQREVFPNLRIGLLHGAMKPAEKDLAMHRFRDHELDILVATSVIEVGIDVPNATVMIIEDADRFGLSQLHQFRGRVGRGKYQSFCYVLSSDVSAQGQDRLSVFQETDDGFRLAEEDLRLRGPGDFVGVRQSGMPELHIANLNDTKLIERTRLAAAQLWQLDPYLRKAEHAALRERMRLFWQRFMAH